MRLFDKKEIIATIDDFKNCQYYQDIVLNLHNAVQYDRTDCIFKFICCHEKTNSIIVTEEQKPNMVFTYSMEEIDDFYFGENINEAVMILINSLMENYLHFKRKIYESKDFITEQNKLIKKLQKKIVEEKSLLEAAKIGDVLIADKSCTKKIDDSIYELTFQQNSYNRKIASEKIDIKHYKNSMFNRLKMINDLVKKFNLPEDILNQVQDVIKNNTTKTYLYNNKNFFCHDFIELKIS